MAYNARNVDAFVACYAQEVVVEGADGRVQTRGRDEMRKRYGELFEGSPTLHAEISARIRVGSYVVDEEHVTVFGVATFTPWRSTGSTTRGS